MRYSVCDAISTSYQSREYFLATFPFVEGISQFPHQKSHTYDGVGSFWHILYPYLLLSTPLILLLQYLYSYVELTPSSLEYQAGLWHRSVEYPQIERIRGVACSGMGSSAVTTEVYGSGMKKMSLKVEQTQEFITELRQYVPQSVLEETKVW